VAKAHGENNEAVPAPTQPNFGSVSLKMLKIRTKFVITCSSGTDSGCSSATMVLTITLTGKCHKIFNARFLANNTPGFPGSQAEASSNRNSYLQSHLLTKIDSALCRIVRRVDF
jgi:hypothetical protein